MASVPSELREGVELLLDLYGEEGPQGLIIEKNHIREMVINSEARQIERGRKREAAKAMRWAIEQRIIYDGDDDET